MRDMAPRRRSRGDGADPLATSADITAALSPFPWLGEASIERLRTYSDLLVAWQARHNLVAPSTLGAVWTRHIADSLQLLPLAQPDARTWLDLGSGAGFPGLVVAIAAGDRQPLTVTLVESNRKKCAFLRAVAAATQTDVDIVHQRIEDHSRACETRYDIVSARALAPLQELFRLAAPYARDTNRFLFPKGQDFVGENEIASKSWCYDLVLYDSVTDRDGRVAVVTHLKPKGASHE